MVSIKNKNMHKYGLYPLIKHKSVTNSTLHKTQPPAFNTN